MEKTAQLLVFAVCVVAGCNSAAPFAFESSSPWPKFRGNAQQDGRATFSPRAGGALWSYPTQKGVFSSPVVGGDGTIYVGSADRTFYALDRAGHLAWQLLTGEIIDSAALLDDRGRVYFGSGDGNLRALEAATGAPVWMTAADAPSVNHAFINWFEGNVALSPSGQLYVPNDNWFVYTVDRQSGQIEQRITMPDQTWSLPAVDGATGDFFLGNNNVVSFLGNNLFAFNAKQTSLWQSFSPGTMAASPMIAGGTLFVGGFDGYVRAFDPLTGTQKWSFRRARSFVCVARAAGRRHSAAGVGRRQPVCARSVERRAEVDLRRARTHSLVAGGRRRRADLFRRRRRAALCPQRRWNLALVDAAH